MNRTYQFSPVRKRSILRMVSITLMIVLINVVLFLLLSFFSSDFILKNIAISLENVKELRLWTFVTSMFMHGGFFHLFANMFSLLFIGSLVERIIGPRRYIMFYLVSGIFAGLLYVVVEMFLPSGLPAVGASGALFGLVGLLVLLTPNLPVFVMFIPIPIKMKYAGPGILAVLWLISVAADIPIGNTAHFGGLVAGIAYGIYLRNKYKKKVRVLGKYFS